VIDTAEIESNATEAGEESGSVANT